MGGNLFTHAMSEAEVQAHKVRLKLRVSEQKPSLLELLQQTLAGSITRSVVKGESGKRKAR